MDVVGKVSLLVLMIGFWIYTRRDVGIRTDGVRESYDYVIVGAGTAGVSWPRACLRFQTVSVLLLGKAGGKGTERRLGIPREKPKGLRKLGWDIGLNTWAFYR